MTVQTLSEMDNDQFLQVVRERPNPSDWELASAFGYAALRMARLQGLVIASASPLLSQPHKSDSPGRRYQTSEQVYADSQADPLPLE